MNISESMRMAAPGNTAAIMPIKVLVLALGGEGGAVMADWLVEALLAAGFPVQSTSVPGVAQRTGATSYYIEFLPVPRARLDAESGRQTNAEPGYPQGAPEPVFCLSPAAGEIDLLISSELLETGRAIERGLVTPQLTTLISSTSRFLTVLEKMQMADGRFDSEPIIQAASQLSRNCALFDMARITSDTGTVISSVMFGALAASGRLPLPRALCEAVIGSEGRMAQASLRGFAQGFDICSGLLAKPVRLPAIDFSEPRLDTATGLTTSASNPSIPAAGNSTRIMGVELPGVVGDIAALGVARLVEYQDEDYARSYLKRIQEFVAAESQAGDYATSRTAARFLALWMAYEDVIRVADLKSRKSRFARIRQEFGATAGEPVVVRDFMKPGVEELAAILPTLLARRLLAWARRRGMKTLSAGLRLQTSSVVGLGLMRTLAALRRWRRGSSRFKDEQALIARWSRALLAALELDPRLARELAECPRLIKGYGDTFARGKKNFLEILQLLVEPALFGNPSTGAASASAVSASAISDAEPSDTFAALAEAVKRARDAALADPDGRALAASLGLPLPAVKVQPLRFMPMKRPR